ncbi:coiled-coil domain-containing protein [Dactylosporangium darangshiense]|uniref:Uncharacterized protein n=1 Tax=Dactylosporangium darangshiense TaxID=579108 RepID=A0ABP8DLK9_9ACTN
MTTSTAPPGAEDVPPQLNALGAALSGAARLLADNANASRDEALHLVALLSDRLQADGRPFVTALEPVLHRAGGGAALTQRTMLVAAQIADAEGSIAGLRDAYVQFQARHSALLELQAEEERERGRLAEFQRLERLAEHLPQLKAQRAALEQRVGGYRQGVVDEETLLAAAAHAIAEFEPEPARLLGERARLLLAQARSVADGTALAMGEWKAAIAAVEREQEEHNRVEHAIREADERRAALRQAVADRAAALRAYAKADRDLLGALDTAPSGEAEPGLEDARRIAEELLDDVAEKLGRVDAALKTMLDALDAQREGDHQVRRLGEGAA